MGGLLETGQKLNMGSLGAVSAAELGRFVFLGRF